MIILGIRTDLAIEMRELAGDRKISGVRESTRSTDSTKTTIIEILDAEGEKKVGKPRGKYITVELPPFGEEADITDDRLKALTDAVSELLPAGAVLVAGIGNRSITPDALGPDTVEKIFATRHISDELQKQIGLSEKLRPVCGVATGVLGQTGIETGEILRSLAESVKPCAVITVDALASRRLSRLGCTVQLCDTGITPGSGVGNSRTRIDSSTVGTRVISIGVPTVVDAGTLAADILGGDAEHSPAESENAGMMVTSKEIDVVIERASKLLSLAINCALQPTLSAEEIMSLT